VHNAKKRIIKMEFLKFIFNSVVVVIFLYLVYYGIQFIPEEKFVYKDEKLKIKEINRFSFDNDTIILLKVQYKDKDFLITKIK